MRKYYKQKKAKNKGFTLIELLVVIAIIGVLSSVVVLASLNSAREKARDAVRLSDMKQIQVALEFYYHEHGSYPASTRNGCGNWTVGNQTLQFLDGVFGEYMQDPPEDPIATGNCEGYFYFRYPAGHNGCDPSKGAFYVLGVTNMEASNRPHPASPGWTCSGRNWSNEMDWVTGGFEQ